MKSIFSSMLLLTGLVSSTALAAGPSSSRPRDSSNQPAVYILGRSHTSSSVLSTALDTLGYSRSTSSSQRPRAVAVADEKDLYTELGVGDAYMEIAQVYPDAKFILPLDDVPGENEVEAWRSAGSNYTDVVRDFFARRGRSQQLLELDVQASKPSVGAEKWVALADFLGLGYSVVERLKLWQFPR